MKEMRKNYAECFRVVGLDGRNFDNSCIFSQEFWPISQI